jgi:hypothetical protein
VQRRGSAAILALLKHDSLFYDELTTPWRYAGLRGSAAHRAEASHGCTGPEPVQSIYSLNGGDAALTPNQGIEQLARMSRVSWNFGDDPS